MPPSLKTLFLTAAHLLAVCVCPPRAAAFPDYGPKVTVAEVPSFVIADKGVRHQLKPFYTVGIPGFPIDPTVRICRCTLVSGPAGTSVSEDGLVEWIPANAEIGNTANLIVNVSVTEGGQEIFTVTKTFSTTVLPEIPQLLEAAPVIRYEQNPIGWSGTIFSGFQPRDAERKLFRWSLINPLPGVYIDEEGGLHWPDDRGYARPEPYVFKVRVDYQTASGPVSDEVGYSRYVLPRPATNDYTDLQTNIQPQKKAMMGYSIASADGWLAAGEPFPDFVWNVSGNPNPGRVRLFKLNAAGDDSEVLAIQPEFSSGSQAFGTSVSLSSASATQPIRLAVGAPGAPRIKPSGEVQVSVGYVYVYACDENGTWKNEGRLDPPVTLQSLRFGNRVSIEGDTLIASLEGLNSAGPNTGALAVYRHNGIAWEFSEMLQVPDPSGGDNFSYPGQLSGGWIAAAATGDDDEGNNSGSVHLFEKVGTYFAHRQEIHAPEPIAGALFGERLEMKGDWLFVSSFRQENNTGAVHVYKRTAGVWAFQQTLISPYAVRGSAFGVGLSVCDDVLAVSAPGYLVGSPEIDGTLDPWYGITLFHLDEGSWRWQRQVTENPNGSPGPNTWGFSLAQISPRLTAASMPDFQGFANGESLPLAGRLFLHRWPELLNDPFTGVLAALPVVNGQGAKANDDSNHNGIPNLIEWMMGRDPGSSPDSGNFEVPGSTRTFIRMDPSTKDVRLMVPSLVRGLSHQPVVEASENLVNWSVVTDARWEALEMVYFPHDGSNYLEYFHPVVIPASPNGPPNTRFIRLSVPAQ